MTSNNPLRYTDLDTAKAPGAFETTAAWLRADPSARIPGRVSAVASLFAVALFVGACSYDVESDVPLGTIVTATATQNSTQPLWMEDAERAGDIVYHLNRAGERRLSWFVPTDAATRPDERAAALRAAGFGNVRLERLTEPRRQSLATSVLERLRLISVFGEGVSDAELQVSLQQQMEAAGLSAVRIEVTHTPDGDRRVLLVGTEAGRSPEMPAEAFFRIETIPGE